MSRETCASVLALLSSRAHVMSVAGMSSRGRLEMYVMCVRVRVEIRAFDILSKVGRRPTSPSADPERERSASRAFEKLNGACLFLSCQGTSSWAHL